MCGHCLVTGHSVSMTNTKILSTEQEWYRRKVNGPFTSNNRILPPVSGSSHRPSMYDQDLKKWIKVWHSFRKFCFKVHLLLSTCCCIAVDLLPDSTTERSSGSSSGNTSPARVARQSANTRPPRSTRQSRIITIDWLRTAELEVLGYQGTLRRLSVTAHRSHGRQGNV